MIVARVVRLLVAASWLRTLVGALLLSHVGITRLMAQPAASATERPITSFDTPLNNGPTALDRYVKTPDSSYGWKVAKKTETPQGTIFVVELTSQTWLGPNEVDKPVWKHWLVVAKPRDVQSNKALLFVGGGKNSPNPPDGLDPRMVKVAQVSKTVVAEIRTIPNQPLVFHGDGVPRVEDDIIAYTWDQFLKTGDERWPARLPMVKSVVKAMDAIQELLASDEGGKHRVDQFVIAGGSKRGWTTWMTAAVDKRVVAILPIVIDVLNVDVSMRHHFAAYGFWAPAIDDYVNHKIMHRRETKRYVDLLKLEDPFAYRDRLTIPKCIINASGDQFFCPDSSQFYFDELPGEKHLCYVPNADHSLDGSNALDTLIAFYHCIVNDVPRPTVHWTLGDDHVLKVHCSAKPDRVLLWHAHNREHRDFRLDTLGRAYQSEDVESSGENQYQAKLEEPAEGWVAYFVQCEFNVGAASPLRLTTSITVLPDVLPHEKTPIPLIEGE